jgi:putative DNA primase/helicase
MYDSGRYFTVTGKHIPGTPLAIHDRQIITAQIHAELFSVATGMTALNARGPLGLSDEDLIKKAKRARNGARLSRLWAGELSDYGHDHSRADAALCRMLAFWTGRDACRMDRIFRSSGLMREKWDRKTGDTTYGARTIRSALSR